MDGKRVERMSEETDETIENTASGVSITTKLKRGTGTRDQDELKIKAKGTTPEEAVENMEEVLEEAEEWVEGLREIQPGQE
jgi:phosphotransferase system HPr-like phosphotransfer protein